MMAAPFILCVYWCTTSPSLGAMSVPPGEVAFDLGGGMSAVLPTVTIGGTAGVTDSFDLGLHYDVHGGIAHDVYATARLSFDRFALRLDLGHVFYAIEEVGGIEAVDSPFGNGAYSTLAFVISFFRDDATHVALGAGATVRWFDLVRRDDLDGLERAFDPILQSAHLEATAEWEGGGGATYVRFVASVPLQAEFRVLGFLPRIVAGRVWRL